MSQPPATEIKLHALDYLRIIRVRWPIVLLVFLLIMITAMVVTYFTPRKYASSATMQVKAADFFMTLFGNGTSAASGAGGGPGFAVTQNEIIQRTEVLYPVVDSLRLTERWGGPGGGSMTKRDAYYRLRSMLQIKSIPSTDLLEITATTLSPKESAEIANSVAEEYQKKRIQEVQNWLGRSLSTLENEVGTQRKEVERLRDLAAQIRKDKNITDLNPDGVEETTGTEGGALIAIEQQVNTERTRVAALRDRNAQMHELSDETIMRSAKTLEIDDQEIMKLWPEYQEAVAEETRMLTGGLGPNHPTIKSLRAKKAERFNQLTQQIAAYRRTLGSQLALAEGSLKAIEERARIVKGDQQSARTNSFEYSEAKNNYIQAKRILEAADMRLASEKMQITMPQSPAVIWEPAEPNNAAVSPKVMLNVIIAAVLGLILGLGLAFFLEYLDTSVKTLEEVEQLLGVPVLAVITKNIKILLNQPDNSPDAEAYRILRTNVEFNRKNPDANTITVVSGGAGEGKSTTIANLAHTFAKGGYNTLVVDADMRRPTQHRIFNASNDRGLTDYLMNTLTIEDVVIPTTTPNLYLMPSGRQPLDAVGILNSQRLDELLTEVKARFDMIFFDSPPILGVSDASILCSAVDYTLVIVQHRRFPKNMLNRVKQAIMNVGGNIIGVVLNNVDVRHDSQYEYYTSYYHYYATPRSESKKDKKAAAKKAAELSAAPRASSRGGNNNPTDY